MMAKDLYEIMVANHRYYLGRESQHLRSELHPETGFVATISRRLPYLRRMLRDLEMEADAQAAGLEYLMAVLKAGRARNMLPCRLALAWRSAVIMREGQMRRESQLRLLGVRIKLPPVRAGGSTYDALRFSLSLAPNYNSNGRVHTALSQMEAGLFDAERRHPHAHPGTGYFCLGADSGFKEHLRWRRDPSQLLSTALVKASTITMNDRLNKRTLVGMWCFVCGATLDAGQVAHVCRECGNRACKSCAEGSAHGFERCSIRGCKNDVCPSCARKYARADKHDPDGQSLVFCSIDHRWLWMDRGAAALKPGRPGAGAAERP